MENNEEYNLEDPKEEEVSEPLGHTDKMIGVFSEPAETFAEMSKSKPKVTDWLIPLVLVIIFSVAASYIIMSNPLIKSQVVNEQLANIQERFDQMVEKGQMSKAQADEQMENVRARMEEAVGGRIWTQAMWVTIITFVVFFIVTGVFMLIAKFGFKDQVTYNAAMSVYGLAQYILLIEVVVMVIVALAAGTFIRGISLNALVGADVKTLTGYLASLVNPFKIWFYVVISIGFAKMFRAQSYGKYFIMVFGLWIGFGLLMFFAAQAFPFLGFFLQ